MLVGITAFVFRPFQLLLKNRMEALRDSVISRGEDSLGYKIEYASMGPSVFGALDIRDIRILRHDGSEFLVMARLRLSYSLLKILGGDIPEALHSIRIDRPLLSLDFKKDAALFDASSGGVKKEALSELLPEGLQIRIRNGAWETAGDLFQCKLANLGLDASLQEGRVVFGGRWTASGAYSSGTSPGLGDMFSFSQNKEAEPFSVSLGVNGRISGEFLPASEEGSARVSIPFLTGENFALNPLEFSVLFRDRRLEIRKIYDKSPAALSLIWDLEKDKMNASFGGENFSPRDLVSFTGSWKEYNSYLAMKISGRFSLEKEEGRDLVYSLDLSGSLPPGLLPGETGFVLAGRGDAKMIRLRDFRFTSDQGAIGFRGDIGFAPLSSNGLLSISDFSPRGTGKISSDIVITTRGREINFFAENFTAGQLTLSALEASFFREDSGLTFGISALRFKDMGSYGDVRLSSLSLDGSLDYDPRHIQASLTLDSFSIKDLADLIQPLAPMAPLPDIAGNVIEDLSVTTEFFFTTDYEHVLYNAPRFVAAYEGLSRDILAVASLSGTDQRFELSGGNINWSGGSAEVNLSADFSNLNDISFFLGASHKDLAYYLDGVILDRRSVSVRGSYGFQAYISAASLGGYSGYVQGENIPIPSGDQYAQLTFLFSLRYDTSSFWSAYVDRFEVTDIVTPSSPYGTLRFSGAVDQDGADIPNLFFDDGLNPLRGNVSLSWDRRYSEIQIFLGINDAAGTENYEVKGRYADKLLDLYLEGEGMRFSRFFRNAGGAEASGNIRLLWESSASFQAESELSSLVFRWQDKDLRVKAWAAMDSREIMIRNLEMDYEGLKAEMPFLRINRPDSSAETEARLSGSSGGRVIDLSFRGRAAFGPMESWLDIEEGLMAFSGSVTADYVRYGGMEAGEPFDFVFSSTRTHNGPEITLSGGPKNMIRFYYSPSSAGEGDFYAAISGPSPVRGVFTGSISSKTIDAWSTDLYVDLGTLWGMLPPVKHIAFPGGMVSASVHITGPLSDPDFYGIARGTSIRIQVPEYLRAEILPVPITVTLEGGEMSFGPVDAAVGDGSAVVSASFRFDRWIPNIFTIDIHAPVTDPIPFGFDISGVLAHGNASGDLRLAMADLIFTISGDLAAHNTEISLNANEMTTGETASYEPGTIATVVDLSIRTGRRVEFFWPRADFPILQAYTDMGTGIRITNDEISRRFSLLGDVKLRSGEIFYFDRSFYIREGTLFFNENEIQFDPRISARAEIRDQSEDGPVTISLVIDNAPLRSFTPRFESSPPLSQMEIFSLLGQNPEGGSGEAGDRRNILVSTGFDVLTQFTVTRRLQNELRDFLNLDMLSLRTQLLQNVVFQAAGINANQKTDQTLNDTRERQNRFGNYFDNTTVFMGKYIGRDMFVQSLFSFRYDENKQTWGGLKLEPDIGLEMQNPLFSVGVNMVPLHPETWFIEDLSFSIIWRRSF
jgi:hypothetical protein